MDMEKDALIIDCLNIGPFQVNTYIVACARTLEGVIIDPGGEEDRIIATIKTRGIHPRYILNTHGHRDHVPANAFLSNHYGIPLFFMVEYWDLLIVRFERRCAISSFLSTPRA